MNILFLLKPKSEVVYISESSTVRQAIEKMKRHSYSAVPVVNRVGEYVGTLSDGDLLWYLTENGGSIETLEAATVGGLLDSRRSVSVNVNATIEDLFKLVMNHNFVSVTDDRNSFIGIVTRRDVMTTLLSSRINTVGASCIKNS